MTPLLRFYRRVLPSALVLPFLTLTYALAIFALLAFGSAPKHDVIYIDLETTQ